MSESTTRNVWWIDGEYIGIGTWNPSDGTISTLETGDYFTVFHDNAASAIAPPPTASWEKATLPISSEFEAVLLDGILYDLYRGRPEGVEASKHFYVVFEKGLKEMKKIVRSKSKVKTVYARPTEY
jgi:hypothetical protein